MFHLKIIWSQQILRILKVLKAQVLFGPRLQKHEINLFIRLDCPFWWLNYWLKLVSFNLYITVYSFVCQFPLHDYWNSYNQKQSSGDFLQKRCSDKFNKIHKKNLCWSLVLSEIADLQHLALSKKTLWHRCFLVNFWEISQKTAFIEPLWTAFCLITHSVYYPTTTSRLNSSLRTILLWGMRSWRSKDFFVKDFLQLMLFLTWHRCTVILTFSKNIILYFYTAKF